MALQRYLAAAGRVPVEKLEPGAPDPLTVATLRKMFPSKPGVCQLSSSSFHAFLGSLTLAMPVESKLGAELLLHHPAAWRRDGVDPTLEGKADSVRRVLCYLQQQGFDVSPAHPRFDADFYSALEESLRRPLDKGLLSRAEEEAGRLGALPVGELELALGQQVLLQTTGASRAQSTGVVLERDRTAALGLVSAMAAPAAEESVPRGELSLLANKHPAVALKLALAQLQKRQVVDVDGAMQGYLTADELRALKNVLFAGVNDVTHDEHFQQWSRVIDEVQAGRLLISDLRQGSHAGDFPGTPEQRESAARDLNAVLRDLLQMSRVVRMDTLATDAASADLRAAQSGTCQRV